MVTSPGESCSLWPYASARRSTDRGPLTMSCATGRTQTRSTAGPITSPGHPRHRATRPSAQDRANIAAQLAAQTTDRDPQCPATRRACPRNPARHTHGARPRNRSVKSTVSSTTWVRCDDRAPGETSLRPTKRISNPYRTPLENTPSEQNPLANLRPLTRRTKNPGANTSRSQSSCAPRDAPFRGGDCIVPRPGVFCPHCCKCMLWGRGVRPVSCEPAWRRRINVLTPTQRLMP